MKRAVTIIMAVMVILPPGVQMLLRFPSPPVPMPIPFPKVSRREPTSLIRSSNSHYIYIYSKFFYLRRRVGILLVDFIVGPI